MFVYARCGTWDKFIFNGNESTNEKILEKLQERIYSLRNAIAHSKEEFDWRLKPNSREIKLLKKEDLDLIKKLSIEIIHYFAK
ncbi:hypothetical protein Dtox_2228 [Desulfofarcimen acetoxidans DSM 771]|uniref:Uncharacterized protein n=1 Tax=Desulfofarcimen acetoxidans (strain ATCC 49208 / DSM 771 / KCTC 5769 / VKM B-1644 / 5575) TaxID=485916 RepID=C8VZR7_DESAS|nr:hypothetical protein [Desulfofarcimen acetoxidans]ACV63045.1 hypothetical protein Dtox_2228 [Desulfofarcimen acetoxidans DSM 771]